MRTDITPGPALYARHGTYSDLGRRPATRECGQPADGGYPADRQLHQMSDDGGPVGPDPARWGDPVWRDNFGDMDTFDEPAGAVAIRRCPYCPAIASHVEGLAAVLSWELGLDSQVEDGAIGEFTVTAGGREVFRKVADGLPPVEGIVELVSVATSRPAAAG